MKTTFLTFFYDYLPNKYYESSAEKLKNDIILMGGSIIVENLTLNGTYITNCLKKPKFIFDALNKHKKDLIWIDCDSEIFALPTEMDNQSEDIGFISRSLTDTNVPHSAVIRFNYNDNTVSFVEDWMNLCELRIELANMGNYDDGDHGSLIETYQKRRDISYKFYSPETASQIKNIGKILIRISDGGWDNYRKIITKG